MILRKYEILGLLFGFLFYAEVANGQTEIINETISNPLFGIVVGYNPVTKINGLGNTILSESYFKNYTLSTSRAKYNQYTVGAFFHYNFYRSPIGLYTEVSYSQQGSELNFSNDEEHFTYNMRFKYQYVNIPIIIKYYPFMYQTDEKGESFLGLHLGIGAQFGFNVANDNISYKSGGVGYRPEFGTDQQQEQQLRNVLKGRVDFGPTVTLGYMFPKIVDFEVRYHHGVNDLVGTQVNSYNFINNKNNGNTVQVVVKMELLGLFGKRYD